MLSSPVGRTPAELFNLKGRVAIVTGGSSGLGVQFAHTLAAAGADVVLAARRVEKLREVASAVESSTGRRCLTVATDASRPEDCTALVSQAAGALGAVPVLVNNAGISRTKPANHAPPQDFPHRKRVG